MFLGRLSVRPSRFRSHNNLRTILRINFKLGSCMHMGGTVISVDFGFMRLKVKVTEFIKYMKWLVLAITEEPFDRSSLNLAHVCIWEGQ